MMKFEQMYIRYLIRRDYQAVLAIENDCFGEIGWSNDDLRIVMATQSIIGLVAEVDGVVAGFIVYQIRCNELEIINLGVCLNYRFSGIGRRLIEHLVSKLHCHRRSRIRCWVRESNLDAQLFFRSLGFEAFNVIKRPYEAADDDAYEFRFVCGQPMQDTRLHLCEEASQ